MSFVLDPHKQFFIRDTLNGTSSSDTLDAAEGYFLIRGFDGDDVLTADMGNSSIIGGNGNDLMEVGIGLNVFIYNTAASGNDTIIGWDKDTTLLGFDVVETGVTVFSDLTLSLTASGVVVSWSNPAWPGPSGPTSGSILLSGIGSLADITADNVFFITGD